MKTKTVLLITLVAATAITSGCATTDPMSDAGNTGAQSIVPARTALRVDATAKTANRERRDVTEGVAR